ncbi:hypothetical protein [Streptomyces sp. bgisy027]|uniref:hypothetical protein n=1 Tax=unclassified Streptomyces TaxID=2593676 RepID=UPI003D71A222
MTSVFDPVRRHAAAIPDNIAFVDALPEGPTGKILKRAVDRSALTGDTALGDVAAGRP